MRSILTWNLLVVGAPNSIRRTLSTITIDEDIVLINSGILIFSQISELGASPLISMLEIPAVTESLNGTWITCMAGTDTATSTVYIYGGIYEYAYYLATLIMNFGHESSSTNTQVKGITLFLQRLILKRKLGWKELPFS